MSTPTPSQGSTSSTSSVLLSSLNTELILVNAQISSAKKLLEEMAHLLTKALDSETRKKDIYHQLLEREKLGNTGIGNGVALPHSRCPQASTAVVAIISLNQGVDYDSIDRQHVDLAFGLLVPEDASQEHLNLLADIARLMSKPANKNKLSAANSPEQMFRMIQDLST